MPEKDRDPRIVRPRPVVRPTMVPSHDQCRCACGSMLARVVREGIELKCRKCKSLVVIPHDDLVAMYRRLEFDRVPFAPPKPRPR